MDFKKDILHWLQNEDTIQRAKRTTPLPRQEQTTKQKRTKEKNLRTFLAI